MDILPQHAIGDLLRLQGRTLSCAESCTGGTVSQLIVTVPGSSDYYLGSVTSYANSIKQRVLGVPDEIIDTVGPVSEECALAMAEGVRKLTGSDYSVSTTGVAGPGSSEGKPSGFVWIGISSPRCTFARNFIFESDRKGNMDAIANKALELLLQEISLND